MNPLVNATINIVCVLVLASIAASIVQAVSKPIQTWWTIRRLEKQTKDWIPQVGDEVIFNSMAGWINMTVVKIHPTDGTFQCERKSANGSSTSWRNKTEVLFVRRSVISLEEAGIS